MMKKKSSWISKEIFNYLSSLRITWQTTEQTMEQTMEQSIGQVMRVTKMKCLQ
jgi:hypothetical protein